VLVTSDPVEPLHGGTGGVKIIRGAAVINVMDSTASALLICMRCPTLSAQLLVTRNRQLGVALRPAPVHRVSSALDFGSAHTAADMNGDPAIAGAARCHAEWLIGSQLRGGIQASPYSLPVLR
jgi:hypothetical protein